MKNTKFDPISVFRQYLEVWMLDWNILYMDEKIRKGSTTFMLMLKPSSTFKGYELCLEVENVNVFQTDLCLLI